MAMSTSVNLHNCQHLTEFLRQLFPASPHQTRASMSKTGDITKITTYVDEYLPHHSSQHNKKFYPPGMIKHGFSNAATNQTDNASWVLYQTISALRTHWSLFTRPAMHSFEVFKFVLQAFAIFSFLNHLICSLLLLNARHE